MELGIHGKNALICASSKGLGRGCATALAREGVNVWLNGRNSETLALAVREISEVAEGDVFSVCCDITTEKGRDMALDATGSLDILVNNAGGPPPGDFHDWGLPEWSAALNNNMLTPIDMFTRVVDGMIDRKFGRVINITSSSVKSPIPSLGLSNGARAGLTGFIAGASRQVASHNVTVNNILPGRFDTDRLRSTYELAAQAAGQPLETAMRQGAQEVPAARFGTPDEFGALCAFLCSVHAGYITGQNILIDGGVVPLSM